MDLNQENQINEVNEIDLKIIANFLLRNKISISVISLIFFFGAVFSTFFIKKVWQGQFQIVLDDKSSKVSSFSNLVGLSGLGSVKKDINTEVGILESPSILLPIFEYVNNEKSKINQNLTFEDFDSWKKSNLKINLKNNTSILRIYYQDTDRNLIREVLDKISTRYTDYSIISAKEESKNSKLFLQDQVNKFKKKSSLSFKAAQIYSIEKDLDSLNFYFSKNPSNRPNTNFDINNPQSFSNVGLDSKIMQNIDIEQIRVKAANRIRDIEMQIKKVEALSDDADQIQFIGSTIPALQKAGLPNLLKNMDEDLLELRSKYTDNDLQIKMKIEKRLRLIKLIKKRTVSYLKAEKLAQESIIEAANRPKEVLIEYKELLREAYRDEMTLVALEDQLRKAEIEESRLQLPWDLITVPTIPNQHIFPSKKVFGIVGIFLGFIFGTIVAFYKEKKSDLFFEEKILENFLNIPTISKINIKDSSSRKEKLIYLRNYIQIENDEVLSFYPIGLHKKENIKLFKKYILESDNNKENLNLIIEENLGNFLKSKNKFLLADLKNLKYKDVSDLKKNINLLDLKIKGIIFIED